jgi:Pilus assembly protein, PilO/Fimbrial assembly protein (PilN)
MKQKTGEKAMRCRRAILLCLGACLALMACPSGPSRSGSSSSGKDEAAIAAREIDHLEGLLARRPVAGRIIEDLMSALPDRVRLTEVSYDSGKVRVKGIAPSNNLLADYVASLGDSPSLADLTLGGSVMKTTRGRESWEFTLAAVAAEPASEAASAGPDPAARLAELEKTVPARQGSAATLREIQRLALDSGLQMTKFAPGPEVAGEFTAELPVAIEVQGGWSDIAGYLRGLAELPGLWVAAKFSCKAVSADDPRSEVRASIMGRTYFAR